MAHSRGLTCGICVLCWRLLLGTSAIGEKATNRCYRLRHTGKSGRGGLRTVDSRYSNFLRYLPDFSHPFPRTVSCSLKSFSILRDLFRSVGLFSEDSLKRKPKPERKKKLHTCIVGYLYFLSKMRLIFVYIKLWELVNNLCKY